MKAQIQVLAVKTQEFLKKNGGGKGSFRIAQCIVLGDEAAGTEVQIGELTVFDDLKVDLVPGIYEAEFGIAVARDTKRIGGQLKSLVPVVAKESRPAVGRNQASPQS